MPKMMNTLFVTTNISVVIDQHGHRLSEVTESMPIAEMPDWGYTLTAVTLSLIGFFGFFLNLCVIILMCKDLQIWTPMNIILFNLVCSDFSVSILGNPFTLTSAIHHKWMFGSAVCEAYGFFMSLLGITSITTLSVLAYERFCLVSQPFSTTHLSKSGAKTAVGLIWIYSFAVTSPPLFGWGKYVSEAADISCSVNWESHTYNATSYIVFLFVFGLIVPVIIIVFSYSMIIKTMKANALRAGRVNKVENRVTSMILVMIIAFLVAWTPYSIFALSEQFGDPEMITPSLAVLPALIAKSSICYNPLIYVGMNSQFRAAWRRICGTENNTNTINETTINQLSETSSKVYIECSFTSFDRKKKNRFKKKQNKLCSTNFVSLTNVNEAVHHNNINNNSNLLNNEIKCHPEKRPFFFGLDQISEKETNYELRICSQVRRTSTARQLIKSSEPTRTNRICTEC